MDIKLKELNTFSRELIIDLAWSEIEKDFEEAIKTFSKKIKLPGCEINSYNFLSSSTSNSNSIINRLYNY